MASHPRKREQPLVRIDAKDKDILDKLSAKTGESTPRLLHRALTALKKQMFFDQVNEGYRNLRKDPKAWAFEQEERLLLQNTMTDGLSEGSPKRRRKR